MILADALKLADDLGQGLACLQELVGPQEHHAYPQGSGLAVKDGDPLRKVLRRKKGGLHGAREFGRDVDGKHVVGLLQGLLVGSLEILRGRLAGGGKGLPLPHLLEDLLGGDLLPVPVDASSQVHVKGHHPYPQAFP